MPPQTLVTSVRKDKGQRSGAGSYSCSGAPQVDDHMSYALMPVLSCPVYQLLYNGHAILTGEEAKTLSSFVDIHCVFQLRHICGLLPLPDSRAIFHNLHSELNHADIPLVAPSLLYICIMLCHWAIGTIASLALLCNGGLLLHQCCVIVGHCCILKVIVASVLCNSGSLLHTNGRCCISVV